MSVLNATVVVKKLISFFTKKPPTILYSHAVNYGYGGSDRKLILYTALEVLLVAFFMLSFLEIEKRYEYAAAEKFAIR